MWLNTLKRHYSAITPSDQLPVLFSSLQVFRCCIVWVVCVGTRIQRTGILLIKWIIANKHFLSHACEVLQIKIWCLFLIKNMMAVMYKIVEGPPPRLPGHLNPALQDLFTRFVLNFFFWVLPLANFMCYRMLDKNPKGRPSAVQILQDPFIKHHMEV